MEHIIKYRGYVIWNEYCAGFRSFCIFKEESNDDIPVKICFEEVGFKGGDVPVEKLIELYKLKQFLNKND